MPYTWVQPVFWEGGPSTIGAHVTEAELNRNVTTLQLH